MVASELETFPTVFGQQRGYTRNWLPAIRQSSCVNFQMAFRLFVWLGPIMGPPTRWKLECLHSYLAQLPTRRQCSFCSHSPLAWLLLSASLRAASARTSWWKSLKYQEGKRRLGLESYLTASLWTWECHERANVTRKVEAPASSLIFLSF